MTTFANVQRTCAVCGHTAEHTVLMSTSAFGAPDLDTRPPPLARLTLPMQIQACPACGYCAPDVSEALPEAAAEVARPEYQAQLRQPDFPYLANLFLCWSRIAEAAGRYAEAGWAVVRAAWACDDEGPSRAGAAVKCRDRAIVLFEQARQQREPFAHEPGAEEAILADLLRRSGRFDEAQTMAEAGLARQPPSTMARILHYQRRLCQRRDTAAHTVEEAPEA